MFTPADRDRMLETLIRRAEEDPEVTGAVLLGSSAGGNADRWSDLDIAFTLAGPASAEDAARRWTGALAADPGVIDHWDLPIGESALIRVFLLPDGLELDLGFYPEGTLVRRAAAWRPVFGDIDEGGWTPGSADAAEPAVVGRTWHHLLHARTCIERGRSWQAEFWISLARTHVIELACGRFGYPAAYAKSAHLLPDEVTGTLAPALVRSFDAVELRRALAAAVKAFDTELRHHDPALADRLRPVLTDA
jgi:predicted nucleotidyltransferase